MDKAVRLCNGSLPPVKDEIRSWRKEGRLLLRDILHRTSVGEDLEGIGANRDGKMGYKKETKAIPLKNVGYQPRQEKRMRLLVGNKRKVVISRASRSRLALANSVRLTPLSLTIG